MRYVIMADGKGSRWGNYMGIPKHHVKVNGEALIKRTVRMLNELDDKEKDIIITSHDKTYDIAGSRRYEPINNIFEIDRFTRELITDEVCFLYGDTYYTKTSLKNIIDMPVDELLFFGNAKSIVAVKVKNATVFLEHIDNVKKEFLAGKLTACKGWQVYASFTGQLFKDDIDLNKCFIFTDEETCDINTPKDYKELKNDELL